MAQISTDGLRLEGISMPTGDPEGTDEPVYAYTALLSRTIGMMEVVSDFGWGPQPATFIWTSGNVIPASEPLDDLLALTPDRDWVTGTAFPDHIDPSYRYALARSSILGAFEVLYDDGTSTNTAERAVNVFFGPASVTVPGLLADFVTLWGTPTPEP